MSTPVFPTGLGREAIYSTLWTSLITLIPNAVQQGNLWVAGGPLTSAQPIQVGSRRYHLPGQGPNTYPRIMLIEKGEIYERTTINMPAIVTLIAHVVIQTADGADQSGITATQINNMADAVEGIVENYPSAVGENQLVSSPGGPPLVFQCRMSGREVVIVSTQVARFSEQDIEVAVIATH